MKQLRYIFKILVFVLMLGVYGLASAQAPQLTIWTDDQRLPVVTELSAMFTEEYGIEVVVEPVGTENTIDGLIRGVGTSEAADIYILPHDNIGRVVESGAATPIDLGDKAEFFLPNALEAFTYNGELYGVPFAIENIGFFRNVELVPDAPATWDEVAQVGSELVDSGVVEYAIALPDLAYNYFPVYTAFGGYIFGQDETGSYLADDVGMGSDGMIDGLAWANALIRDGYASENLDWEAAHVLFESGQAPFIMTGPWAVARFQSGEVPYEITAFPSATEDGEAGAPFIGVQGFMLNPDSENLLIAQTFLTEFIATEEAQQFIFDADPRPSAWLSIFEATEDADMQGFAAAGENGLAMPAIPAMGFVWDAWGNAGLLTAQGELTPEEALTDAQSQIITQIEENE